MFKKFLKNLPFNPSLIEHVPAHIKTLKRDSKIRIVALVFFVLAIIVQIFVSIYPSQPSLTNSPNDLINGGFASVTEAVNDCNNNVSGYKNILNYFGIECPNILYSHPAKLKSTDNNNQLYSINRLGYGLPSEEPLTINQQTFWARNLSTWDKHQPTNYSVLKGSTKSGANFALLLNSGDLVTFSRPNIGNLNCDIYCVIGLIGHSISVRNDSQNLTNANHTIAKPGSTLIYTIALTNPSSQSINNYTPQVNFSSVLSYAHLNNSYGGNMNSGTLSWPKTVLKSRQTITREASFTVDSPIPKTPLSSTDPGYYNSKMTTVYGNTLVVNVPTSLSKYTELSLNNWLPFENRVISFTVAGLIALMMLYFIALNRLMINELRSLRDE